MISVIIVLAIILIVAISIAFGLRKKHYTYIDKAEERKVELMNSPVLEEVARIRSLNVVGEAEGALSGWKEKWEEVMSKTFPELEQTFFQCESMVEKFRFKKAGEFLDEINDKLDEIEEIFEGILEESGDLLKIAKKNEEDLNIIQIRLREKKQYIVEVNHLLGETAEVLDERIGTLLTVAEGIKEKESVGDYFAAEQAIDDLDIKFQVLENTIKVIPDLINECNKNVPDAIDMLKHAHKSMENEGYPLENLKIAETIKELEISLLINRQSLEIAVIEGVKEALKEINGKINEICRQLEGETNSRVVVKGKIPVLIKMLGDNKKCLDQLLDAVDDASVKYRIPDKVEDSVIELKVKFLDCAGKLEQSGKLFSQKEEAFSIIEKQLEAIEAEIVRMNLDLTTNIEDVASLMVDEQKAINKVAELRENFSELESFVRLSNAPGVSIRHQTISSDTLASIEEAGQRLLDTPLNIVALKDAVYIAERKTATLRKEANELVDNARLAEKVIQYGNRYRIGNEPLSAELDRATEKFLIFEYTKSLEIASIAIEQVEPGFAKKFDATAGIQNELAEETLL